MAIKNMITIAKARKILGKSDEKLTDEEIQLVIDQCYALAEVMFEHFKFEEKMKGGGRKNAKLENDS